MYIISIVKAKFIEWSTVFYLLTRISLMVVLFNLMTSNRGAFEGIDHKIMFDQVYYIGLLSMLLFTSNIKIDLLLSVPITLIGTYFTMSWSF